jgi:DNA repair protein RadA
MSEELNIVSEEVNENVQEDEELVEKSFSLKDLPGIGPATANKLEEGGYSSILSISVASPREIGESAGVTESVARKIIQFSRDKMGMGFETGLDLLEKRKLVIKITTMSEAFNELLGGGMETGCITECYGAYGSGKTALAHQVAVSSQLPKNEGGTGGMVVWIDTEGTFRPERIKQISEEMGLDYKKILGNIRTVRAFNSDHQMLLTEKVEDLIIKEKLPIKLVIVDSLMAHFRSEFIGRGTLADRQQKLNKHMHALLKLTHTFNLAVYITNQVMSKPDTFFGDPTVAIGGHIVAHASTVRLYLRRGKKGARVAKLVDSPCLPDGECMFYITNQGIRDA